MNQQSDDPALAAAAGFDAARQALDFVMKGKAAPHFVAKAAQDFYEKGRAFELAVPNSDAGRLAKLKEAEGMLAFTLSLAPRPLPTGFEGANTALEHIRALIGSLDPSWRPGVPTAPPTTTQSRDSDRPSATIHVLRPSDT